ncbi:MAG: GTPase [Candidatus Brocadiia bacterium]
MTTYYSVSIPSGQGGISVIELFGSGARRVIAQVFRPIALARLPVKLSARGGCDKGAQPTMGGRNFHRLPPANLRPDHFYLGNICRPQDLTQKIDQAVIRYIRPDQSLTGLDTVEINAHGGQMSVKLITNALKSLGAKESTTEQVIRLAGRKKKGLDKIQQSALRELLQARTLLAGRVLLAQYQGALSKALSRLKRMPESGRNRLAGQLLQSARLGIALTRPRRVVIIGRPNVGKSTLFNALVGHERVLVHHRPGTTRDSVEELIAVEGVPFKLIDTAGLRQKPGGLIEKAGIGITRSEIARADVLILVLDATKGLTPADKEMLAGLIPKKTITVYNKSDLAQSPELRISALKGTGIDRLRKRVIKAIGLSAKELKYKFGTPVLFDNGQMNMVKTIIKK